MSTRAIFKANTKSSEEIIYIYNHCDNYPDNVCRIVMDKAVTAESILQLFPKAEICSVGGWNDDDVQYKYDFTQTYKTGEVLVWEEHFYKTNDGIKKGYHRVKNINLG